jgi:hypothetical protein
MRKYSLTVSYRLRFSTVNPRGHRGRQAPAGADRDGAEREHQQSHLPSNSSADGPGAAQRPVTQKAPDLSARSGGLVWANLLGGGLSRPGLHRQSASVLGRCACDCVVSSFTSDATGGRVAISLFGSTHAIDRTGSKLVEMGESRTPRPGPFVGDHYERVRCFVVDRPNGHRHPAGRSSHVPLDRA